MSLKRYVIGLGMRGIARGDEPMLGIETHTSTRWRNALVAMAVVTAVFSANGAHLALADETNRISEASVVALAELQDAQLLLARIDQDVSDALNAVNLAIEAAAFASDPSERVSVPGGIGGV